MHDDHDHDHDHDHDNPWADRINEAYYDAMGTAFGQKTRERINWMCKQARGETVLDIGCSQGIASILMAREGMAVTGLDIYPPAIEYALAERAKEIASVQQRMDFRCGELAAIGDEQFDTVVMGEVVEHQTNPVRFIRQGAARVAPGGRVIITVPYGLHPWPDHKSTIFPRDLHNALADEFALETIEVTDGYVRVVADRRRSGDAVKDDMQLLLRATETGAVDAQESYYAANVAGQEHAKAKGPLESTISSMRDEHGKLAARASGLERDLAVSIERANGLQSALELARQAVVDRSAEYAEALHAQRDEHTGRMRAQEALAESHARRAEELFRQVADLQVEIAEVRASERTAVSRVEELRIQCESHVRRVDELLQAHADMQVELADVRVAERTAAGRAAALQAQCESYVRRSDELLQKHADLQAELADMRDAERTATGRMEALQDAHRTRSRTLQEALDSAHAREHELQGAVDGLNGRLGKLTADLAEAQEKRSGHWTKLVEAQEKRSAHWAKLVSEQTRSKRLIALAQTLHEDNQRYEHSIALAIGRAMLGLGRLRGIIGFPRAMARVVRLYRQRRNGALPFIPLVLPPLSKPRIVASPANAGVVSRHDAEEAARPRSKEQKKKLAVIGWEQENAGGLIPAMSVLDEFSSSCFAPHANLIEARPDNWEGLLEKFSPRFLLAESAWRGNRGAWRYRVAATEHPPGNEFADLVDGFRGRGLPTVFWNKEDPVHFNAFIDSASACDVILTTSAESIERYRLKTSARVEVMQFAAEDTLQNPQGSSRRNGRVCFAGSYYAEDFSARQSGQSMLLGAAKDYELDIYDRNHRAVGARGEFAFPEEYAPYIRGRLGYEDLSRKYREYQVFLNVNSVDDSSTMFSRRVFELLACGTPVISTWSRAIAETFGEDIVWQVRNRAEAEEALRVLTSDSQEWRRRSLAGIRAVLSQHTFRHRFARILSLVGQRATDDLRVIAIAEAADQVQADAVFATFRRQQTTDDIRTQLLIVCRNGFRLEGAWPDDVRAVPDTQAPLARLVDRERESAPGAVVALLSPHAVYGCHYLQDAVHAVRYSGALVVGKAAGGTEYEWGQTLDPRTLVINTAALGSAGTTAMGLLDAHGDLTPAFMHKAYASDSANFAALEAGADRDALLRKIEI